MARRKTSRVTALVLATVGVVAIGAWALNRDSTPSAGTDKLLADQAGPRLDDPAVAGQLAQVKPTAMLLLDGKPATTQPLVDPAATTKPAAATDIGSVLQQATALNEQGDLVTARDLLNDALVNGASEADAADLKAFLAQLNSKIILGVQKFPADPYNKTWKVEPGTALWKLSRRFDVTAELLCRVNGLKDASKLRAGVTIKAIQGPFHLVVSKKKFEADLYLGAPGGEGSMYLKTYKVGLGSDGSTPTGLWLVETGKVTNPVYYSPRGEGVIAGDDPKNPLGERWLPLKGIEGGAVGQESYGIHGTIEPDSIGKNMSLGCIRLLHDDIVEVYDLLVEGKSKVRVVD
jgi:LysM repeat protein